MVCLYYHLGPEGLLLFPFKIELFIGEVTDRGLIEAVCLFSFSSRHCRTQQGRQSPSECGVYNIYIRKVLPVDMLILFLSCSL